MDLVDLWDNETISKLLCQILNLNMKEPTKDQHHNQWDETFPWSWKLRVNQQVHCPLERARKRKGKAVKDPKVAHQMVNNNDQDLHRVLIIWQLPANQLATSIPDLPTFYETKLCASFKEYLEENTVNVTEPEPFRKKPGGQVKYFAFGHQQKYFSRQKMFGPLGCIYFHKKCWNDTNHIYNLIWDTSIEEVNKLYMHPIHISTITDNKSH